MVGPQSNTIASILLDEFLSSKRQRTFLRRNLEYVRRQPQAESTTRLAGGRQFEMPRERELNRLINRQKERSALNIQIEGVKRIQRPKRQASRSRSPRKKARLDQQAWLFQLPIRVYIAIVNTESAPGDSGPMKIEVCNVRTSMIGTETKEGPDVGIEMQSQKITVEELLKQTNGSLSRWSLQIAFKFLRREGADEFISYMDPSLWENTPTQLVAEWADIQRLPKEGTLLPLQNEPGGKSRKLNLGLKCNVFWEGPKEESILATYNRQKPSSRRSAYPTPPKQDPQTPSSPYMAKYVFDGRAITRPGLICPYDSCTRAKPKVCDTVDQLIDHLRYCHPRLIFNASKQRVAENSCQVWDFVCEDEEKSNAENQNKPHDRNNISFVSGGNCNAVRSQPAAASSNFRSRRPDEVPARKLRVKKRYPVPAVEGVTFFTLNTKRPLKTGELVSESDEEVDMGWLRKKLDSDLDADDTIPSPARELIKMLDDFIGKERICGIVHLGDAYIRFVRANAAILWKENLIEPFLQKLDELRKDEQITTEVHAAAREQINHKRPSSKPPSPNKGRTPKTKRGLIARALEPDAHGRCLCGEDALLSAHSNEIVECRGTVSSASQHCQYSCV